MLDGRVHHRDRYKNIINARSSSLGELLNQDRADALRKIVPPGWTANHNSGSIILHRIGNPFPSIKVTFDGTVFHDYGTRRSPKSERVNYESTEQMLEIVRSMLAEHLS